MIEKTDEKSHVFGSHRYWNESWYFNFMSENETLAGATRIGFSPNRGMRDGFIILYFPDGKSGFIRMNTSLGDMDSIHCGKLSFTCLSPFDTWKIHYDGPIFLFDDPQDACDFHTMTLNALPTQNIVIDLEFCCYHAPFDFHNAMKIKPITLDKLLGKLKPSYFLQHLPIGIRKLSEIHTMKGAQHYEQAGYVTGTITLNGLTHQFRGTGQRDHSWGVRDMRMITEWQWFSCQFGEALAFNVTRVETLAIQAIGGHAWYDGACHSLQHISLHTDYDASGRWAKTFRLDLTLEDSRTLSIKGTTQLNFPVQLTTEGLTAVVNEGLATFEWNNRRSIGISEYMGQCYP